MSSQKRGRQVHVPGLLPVCLCYPLSSRDRDPALICREPEHIETARKNGYVSRDDATERPSSNIAYSKRSENKTGYGRIREDSSDSDTGWDLTS